jgi:putative FmdB family regulatory protein
VPTYDYRCRHCGPFVRLLPMREVTATSPCPGCAAGAPRVFAAPALLGGSTALSRAQTTAEASASEPGLATRASVPERAPIRLPGRLGGLPRP